MARSDSAARLLGHHDVFESLEELIGHTPLVRFGGAPEHAGSIYLKLETFNPGGTVKDRTAFALIQDAETTGKLHPGGVIVEPTSGNTGLGLAWIAARKGYQCIFTVTDKVSDEKINLLKAYGAEVVICPSTVPPDDPDSYYSVAKEIASSIVGAYSPEQYSNPANHRFHYSTTGPEIWRQTDGRVSCFVAGAGTGGTISGVGMYLKERNPEVRVICADPAGSIYSNPDPHGYLTEGVGEDFVPANFLSEYIDDVLPISDADAFAACHKMTREQGLIVGSSGGMVIAAALRASTVMEAGDLMVALIPDSGRAYLSKVYAHQWMLEYGFEVVSEAASIGDMLAAGDTSMSEFLTVTIDASVGDAMELLKEFSLPALPVAVRTRPAVVSEVVGSVSLRRCCLALSDGEAASADPVASLMLPPLPMVGIGEGISAAIRRLDDSELVLVADHGRPVALLTAAEMLRRSIEIGKETPNDPEVSGRIAA